MRTKQIYTIDGNEFSSIDEFFEVVSKNLIPGSDWGRNLNAFNDILRGGFGTPEEGFILRWKNSDLSRGRLGYEETMKCLESALERCHPTGVSDLERQLKDAKLGKGQTAFDWLVEIIEDHCKEGKQAEDGVELRLE